MLNLVWYLCIVYADWCTCFFGLVLVLSEIVLQPKSFMVGSDGAELSYYGCTVSIPPGALDEDTEICLEILNTNLPEMVVSPVLKLEPSNLTFHCTVTVTLPVFISPSTESHQPQLTLMCCTHGEWSKLKSTKLKLGDPRAFKCTHFSAYCWITDEDGIFRSLKRLACLMYKGAPKENQSEVTVAICDDLKHVIEVNICLSHMEVHR